MERQTFMLVPSTTRGRYALGRPDGADVSSGMYLEIKAGSRWITGYAESAKVSQKQLVMGTYATDSVSTSLPVVNGYYFVTDDDDIVGLCVGMQVRLHA